jgi:hypothetical protein
MTFQIREVKSKSDWMGFIDLPWDIYRGDPYWVPPLKIAVKDLLNTKKNPFFKHATMRVVNAYRNGKCVGRVVGIIDDNHNKFHQENTAFFGFFESIKDQDVVDALMNDVSQWAKSQGKTLLRGPISPSTNHECGLLVEGFNDSPTVMMTYNPSYYVNMLENWGLKKAKDLLAYNVNGTLDVSERLLRHSERLKKKSSVRIRPINIKEFDKEVERIFAIYNDAWESNWGFVPMEPEEFRHLAKDLRPVVDPELCLIVELRGEIVGFGLSLPDVNQAIKKVKDGKLFPTGIFKLLWNIKGPGKKKTINRCRIITLGIRRAFREAGIGPILYTEYLKRGPALGYPIGEASWVLEDNQPMNKALALMCGKRSKVYRIYDRTL